MSKKEIDALVAEFNKLENSIKQNQQTIKNLQQETASLEIAQGKIAAKINYLNQQAKK